MPSLVDKVLIALMKRSGQDPLINAAKFLEKKNIHYAEENIIPDYRFHDYNDASTDFLKGIGIQVLADDVDETLMGFRQKEVHEAFIDTFNDHKQNFRVYIVSNSGERRYRELSTMFPDVPVLKMYQTDESDQPINRMLFENQDILWIWKNGDQHILYQEPVEFSEEIKKYTTPLNLQKRNELPKPNPQLNDLIMALEKLDDPAKIAWIGDRLSAEITTANQAGATSIWVDQFIDKRNEPSYIKIARRKEASLAKKSSILSNLTCST
ncbi:MAG: hypothetical protein GXP63_04120 [DPANN group archaeon]|nr:hypothetical protein [DPANN group archaeon]